MADLKGYSPPPESHNVKPIVQVKSHGRESELIEAPLGFFGLVIGIALAVAFFLFGNGAPLSQVLGGMTLILSLAISYRYPFISFWIFLIYLPFTGTVAYWVGDDHFSFHLAKDVFYFPALVALIQRLRKNQLPIIIPPQLELPLIVLTITTLLTLGLMNGIQQLRADPDEYPLAMGIFGLKVLIGYIPLVTCGFYLIQTRQTLFWFGRVQVIVILICCVLGLIQYWLVIQGICPDNTGLPDHLLLRANLQRKCLVGGALGYFPIENFIRLPGTFVSPWHWAWFLISGVFFSFATAASDPALPWRLLGFFTLSLILVNSIICGQRVALLVVPVILIILLIAVSQVSYPRRILGIGLGIFGFIGGVLALFPQVIIERIDSLIARWTASPPGEFVTGQIQWITEIQDGFLGHGLGRATNAVRGLGETQLIETYFPKIFYEIGPFGLLAFLGVVTILVIQGYKTYRKLSDRTLKSYAVVFWLFIFLISYNSYWYPLDTDPVAVYYWLTAGILLKLPQLEVDRL
ncbi:MAG: hypothetical protein HC835_12395 [Oscillatoriales cyanobacterium RM2_1_1]|nr:hypothetical protein [Oscillatoriales cyanobacterium SM2_3_0]NJO46356.1 hypothetical protein [Oscillatoriales cyanobacterium RM2_1_1]